MSTTTVPEGWYEDPDKPDQIRRWDVRAWTDDVYPLSTAMPAPLSDEEPKNGRRMFRSSKQGRPDSAEKQDQGGAVRAATDDLEGRMKSWKAATVEKRNALEAAHSRYVKEVRAARKQVKAAMKPRRLAGGALEPVTVFETPHGQAQAV